jgi:hypothetical protein
MSDKEDRAENDSAASRSYGWFIFIVVLIGSARPAENRPHDLTLRCVRRYRDGRQLVRNWSGIT